MRRLSEEQRRLGHRIVLATTTAAEQQQIPSAEHERRVIGRSSERLPSSVRSLAFAVAVARCLKRWGQRVDIVHAHGDFIEAAVIGRAAERAGIPFVITVHGGLTERYRPLMARGYRYPQAAIAVSSNVRNQLMELGVPAEKVAVASSGIQPSARADAWRPERVSGRVVCVASLDRAKGHDVLLEACRRVRKQGIPISLHLHGSGPLETELRRLAADLNWVLVHGQSSAKDVCEALQTAEVFALASRPVPGKSEGAPTAIMEAMYYGAVVVATRVGGIPDLVRPMDTGWLVEPNDADALAGALRSALRGGERRDEMARRARAAIKERTWPVIAARVEEVYATAVQAVRGSW